MSTIIVKGKYFCVNCSSPLSEEEAEDEAADVDGDGDGDDKCVASTNVCSIQKDTTAGVAVSQVGGWLVRRADVC